MKKKTVLVFLQISKVLGCVECSTGAILCSNFKRKTVYFNSTVLHYLVRFRPISFNFSDLDQAEIDVIYSQSTFKIKVLMTTLFCTAQVVGNKTVLQHTFLPYPPPPPPPPPEVHAILTKCFINVVFLFNFPIHTLNGLILVFQNFMTFCELSQILSGLV